MSETDQTRRLYARALEAWGTEAQVRMVQEECAELITAINKWSRHSGGEKNVIEEAADVEIMIGQLRVIVGDDRIDAAKRKKLSRLSLRLDKAERIQPEEPNG